MKREIFWNDGDFLKLLSSTSSLIGSVAQAAGHSSSYNEKIY
jgi:hypothetical protein